MDVLGVLLIYLHSPRVLHARGSRAYISLKPFIAVLQHINVTLCMGGLKAIAGQYILYCPATRAMSRYCPGTSFL